MSTTDAALDWLLSLAATCTSSPLPPSTPPDFTDWLHISPTSSSPPLQDVSSSSRINLPPQGQSLGLHYFYDLSGAYGAGSTADAAPLALLPSSVAIPTSNLFNQHHRMLSLDSTAATLINTPSPRTLALFSPATAVHQSQTIISPRSPALFASPASKLIQELQRSPFGNYYYDATAASLPTETISDISPVVRADKLDEYLGMPKDKPATKSKKKKRRNRQVHPSSFVEKLRAIPEPGPSLSASCDTLPVDSSFSTLSGIPLESSSTPAQLLSPYKLVHALPALSELQESLHVDTPAPPQAPPAQKIPAPVFATPPRRQPPEDAMAPLSPLTPLTSSPSPRPPPNSPPRLKIILRFKRKLPLPDPSTPVRRSKRPRPNIIIESPLTPESDPTPSVRSSPGYNPSEKLQPVYTNRTLPGTIEVSSNFPLFYRRFPASSYYKPPDSDSPCTLFGSIHPGGLYNPPRSIFDLYTPRFVRGKGVEKVGLCPICLEPHNRGGENRKLWLAMKFSAFKCYHMQYTHGISASTGRPFSPPIAFRTIQRPNPGKKEKHSIQEGKCHKCAKWIAVEGVKDMESKVKELHWWKHAAACHHNSTLQGEGDYFENDEVFSKLAALEDQAA